MGCVCICTALSQDMIYLEILAREGHKPDISPYGKLVDSCCRQENVDYALLILSSLHQIGVSPSERMYDSVIGHLCFGNKNEEVGEFLKEIVSYKIYPNIYVHFH